MKILNKKESNIYIYIERERERERAKFSLVGKKSNITSYILVKQKEILALGSFRKEQDKKDFLKINNLIHPK